jgi:hypothetical protein
MSDLKTRVQGEVNFVHYQDGNLIYRCNDGFEFPVPISDCGSARFPAKEKAMLFMRWIRKHMTFTQSASEQQS